MQNQHLKLLQFFIIHIAKKHLQSNVKNTILNDRKRKCAPLSGGRRKGWHPSPPCVCEPTTHTIAFATPRDYYKAICLYTQAKPAFTMSVVSHKLTIHLANGKKPIAEFVSYLAVYVRSYTAFFVSEGRNPPESLRMTPAGRTSERGTLWNRH